MSRVRRQTGDSLQRPMPMDGSSENASQHTRQENDYGQLVTSLSGIHKSKKNEFQGRSAEAGFFRNICGILPARKDVSVVCVLPAVDKLFDLRLVLPKPKSAAELVRREIERRFSCHPLTREWAANPKMVIQALRDYGLLKAATKIMIVDIGGYFAGSIYAICEKAPAQIIGVMEGTENGLKKYERQGEKLPLPVPVYTVARSPLKYPENYLIGVSVVFFDRIGSPISSASSSIPAGVCHRIRKGWTKRGNCAPRSWSVDRRLR